ncbi:nucleolar MIF4G domain-containing protein 1 [Microdochium nivale]|nr:nucleolar MIF4G domain-containing protein 1 [Microdochium nivale]
MKPKQNRKLSLPAILLKELDATPGSSSRSASHGGRGGSRSEPSRKEQRKAQRVTKRQSRTSQPARQPSDTFRPKTAPSAAKSKVALQQAQTNQADDNDDNDNDDLSDGDDLGSNSGAECSEDEYGMGSDDDNGFGLEDGFESDESDGNTTDIEMIAPAAKRMSTVVSKSDLKKLAQDDAEIDDLERKLGLKGRKAMPKSFDEDGLGNLLDGLGGVEEFSEKIEKHKRKAEADEWLAQKRRKAQQSVQSADLKAKVAGGKSRQQVDTEDSDDEDHYDDGSDGFDGISGNGDVDNEKQVAPQRENPYVAPTTNIAKYVPPSLRRKTGNVNDEDVQLRKRIQGLMNRLTNDSMIGITKDILHLYTTNPRQAVTSILTDILLALVCSPEKRPDSFFTMIAGFIAATHKALGMAFTAQFVQHLVEVFDKYYANASGNQSDTGSKHAATLMAELYNMQVINCSLVFDYTRLFLQNLNELSTELLLRIIQLCGPSLRRDDSQSLQQIVNRVKPADMQGISVRTSFMIEEMKKLQSNKTKANARNKDLADQRTQIRKKIGTLPGSQDAQPLRVGLQDIRNADKVGKWWLVGASWAGKNKGQSENGDIMDDDADDVIDDSMDFEQIDDDLDIPDLWQLARGQGFNTEVRQRIFVALHAATDYENADLLLKKLKLNKHQRKEIPEVIVRSGERQMDYNPYYALVAGKFCGDREVRFQFRRCLTTRFRKMGEDIDTGDGEDADLEEESEYSMRWLYNSAKLYGTLVGSRFLGLNDIVKYRNLMALREKAQVFVELVLITVLQGMSETRLREVLGSLDEDVVRGVQYFIKKHVRSTDLVSDRQEKKKLKKSCDTALNILESMQTIDTA